MDMSRILYLIINSKNLKTWKLFSILATIDSCETINFIFHDEKAQSLTRFISNLYGMIRFHDGENRTLLRNQPRHSWKKASLINFSNNGSRLMDLSAHRFSIAIIRKLKTLKANFSLLSIEYRTI